MGVLKGANPSDPKFNRSGDVPELLSFVRHGPAFVLDVATENKCATVPSPPSLVTSLDEFRLPTAPFGL